jgi:hypothetical protein
MYMENWHTLEGTVIAETRMITKIGVNGRISQIRAFSMHAAFSRGNRSFTGGSKRNLPRCSLTCAEPCTEPLKVQLPRLLSSQISVVCCSFHLPLYVLGRCHHGIDQDRKGTNGKEFFAKRRAVVV